MDGLDLVDAKRSHGQGNQGGNLVANLQVAILEVFANVGDLADEHAAGTGHGVLLLAALRHDAKDHFADLLLVATAGLFDLGEGCGVNVEGDNVADDLVGINLGHVVVDFVSRLGQHALGLDNAMDSVLVAFEFHSSVSSCFLL